VPLNSKKEILIFHVLATYFVSYDLCLYFDERILGTPTKKNSNVRH
jgi:hypothetical protein